MILRDSFAVRAESFTEILLSSEVSVSHIVVICP